MRNIPIPVFVIGIIAGLAAITPFIFGLWALGYFILTGHPLGEWNNARIGAACLGGFFIGGCGLFLISISAAGIIEILEYREASEKKP
ncbi:MAG TPA: hypothetical protein VHB73_00930 [Alphaproteobacteria bacterium]|nr:hypothetical protein [Alphaproteobacteria bacterium]